jgi:hypothetical protein
MNMYACVLVFGYPKIIFKCELWVSSGWVNRIGGWNKDVKENNIQVICYQQTLPEVCRVADTCAAIKTLGRNTGVRFKLTVFTRVSCRACVRGCL